MQPEGIQTAAPLRQQVESPMPQLSRAQMTNGSSQMVAIQSNGHVPNVSKWLHPGMSSAPRTMLVVLDAPPPPSTLGLVGEQARRRALPDAFPPSSTPSVVGEQARRWALPDALPPTSAPSVVGEQPTLQSNACSHPNSRAEASQQSQAVHNQGDQRTFGIQPNGCNLEIQHALQSQAVDGVREVCEGTSTDNTVIQVVLW